MPRKEPRSGTRLNRLSIKNYKKLDELEIEFPRPLMPKDTDILVFGSENGGGKTSVLECCSLLMLAGTVGKGFFEFFREIELSRDITDLLIKSGCQQASIKGDLEQSDKKK